ncbi:MAG: sigma-70 family RNA polymerase sigma factor [Candidatus Eremiobacteraeota bacterium]|nr:sigma-70 family RNA polymerase sigma factor [Candidatus Eremiobacteraeota bacterium]MBC5827372.1 sigma-70 family RNA polymerase sigma factor [Candidatus Eremiobacteraeota bacterium]
MATVMCGALTRQGEWRWTRELAAQMSDDLSLFARLCRRDHAAFSELYDHHARMVYGVAKRVLGNPTQAEDVTQSVFLQLWSRPTAFQGGNFVGWLARVARNKAIDILRSSSVRTREPDMPLNVASEAALEDEVFSRARADAVAGAVAMLPADQRTAIEQAYFGGLSYREVAERTGTPVGTIKSRIRAGLRRLWEDLEQVVAS